MHDYLAEHGINAETVHLDGAVESSVQLGVADLIADVVSTGTTLRNAGLRIFAEPLLHSEAVLIRSPRLAEDDDRLTILSRRLQGVLTAQRYVLMDYDIPVEKVSAAVDITPGFESPTVSRFMTSSGRPCVSLCRRPRSTNSWTSCMKLVLVA